MAPELLKEKPYNHSVDIWSYGIILYELFTGIPPFHTNSLYSLIEKIVKNPIKYPDNMSSEFKSFLQGLLIKEPSKRMSWREIVDHPFLNATNADLEEEKKIRKKYNNWLRQVAQWNNDFDEFKSSKINFFQSEIFNFDNDDNGFTSFNSNKIDGKKKSKKIKSTKEKKIEDLNSDEIELSLDNMEERLKSLIINKKNTNSFFEQFSNLLCNPTMLLSSKVLLSIHNVIIILNKNKSELFTTFPKSTANIQSTFKTILKSHKNDITPKNLSICLINLIYVSDFKNIWKIVIENITDIISFFSSPDLETSYIFLDLLREVFYQIQKNFNNSQKFIQEFISQRLPQNIFLIKKNIITNDVISTSKGRKIISKICYPQCTELISFPILQKKSTSTLNNSYSSQTLALIYEFHEIIFTFLIRRLEELKIYKLSDSNDKIISESYYLKLILKSLRFVDNLSAKIKNSQLLTNLSKLSRSVTKLPPRDQLILFLLLAELTKQRIEKIYIDIDLIFNLLQQNIGGKDPLLLSSILFYLSSLMDDTKFISHCIEYKFKSIPKQNNSKQGSKLTFYNKLFIILRKILKLSEFKASSFLRPEICSFGFANFGAFDGTIKILLANLLFASKKKDLFLDYLKGFTYYGVKDVIFYLFEKMTNEFVLSLKGLVYLFSLIVELITNTKEHLLIIEDLLKESRIKLILSFLNEDLFGASKTWPKKLGGNGVFDECLCNHVLKLIELLISGILRNNNKKYMKLLANQMKTFPNLMYSIMNVYLQSMGISKMDTSASYKGFSAKMANYESVEYIKNTLLPKRSEVIALIDRNHRLN